MKQKLTLSCIVMLITETICLFIPYCFVEEYWSYEESIVYHGISKLTRETPINIFGVSTGLGRILAIVLIISLIAAIWGFVMAYIKKQGKTGKLINFMPLINLALLVTFAFYAYGFAENDTVYGRYEWSIHWLFYIIIALQIITCIFGMLIQFEKNEKPTIVPVKIENTDTIESSTDKLRRYKELLDSGIITEEEFEAKKRRILKL